jgi:hypothetical protein
LRNGEAAVSRHSDHAPPLNVSKVATPLKEKTSPIKRLLSIKDLVTVMGATEWFWRSLIWDGKLQYVQVGKKIFVDREDVESFIQRNKHRN